MTLRKSKIVLPSPYRLTIIDKISLGLRDSSSSIPLKREPFPYISTVYYWLNGKVVYLIDPIRSETRKPNNFGSYKYTIKTLGIDW
jgi:hypothetical protein